MNITNSILQYKCPRCRQGDLFKKPVQLNKPFDMNECCEHCGQSFSPEPGYYYGAMFISYIWTAFASLAIVGICLFVFDWSVNASMGFLVFLGIISFFWVLRISRSMYIHLDVRYDEKLAAKALEKQST